MVRVLVLEDEPLIAEMLIQWLNENGFHVIGRAATIGQALSSLDAETPDVAILDVSLADGVSYPIARELRIRQIPFVFATGYLSDGIDAEFHGVPVVKKPFEFDHLLAQLHSLVMIERARLALNPLTEPTSGAGFIPRDASEGKITPREMSD